MKTQYCFVKYARAALAGALVALIAGCGGYGGGSYSGSGQMTTTTNTTVSGAELTTLTRMTTIGSTIDPIERGGNPYGLTVATATGGLVTKAVPTTVTTMSGYTTTNTQTDVIYFNDDNSNTVVELSQ